MVLNEFCVQLAKLDLSHQEIALSILWFHDEQNPDTSLTAGELSAIISHSGLGTPHSTRLGIALKKSGHVLESSKGYRLKVLARPKLRARLNSILSPEPPPVEQELGFLPRAVWDRTRGYIESICQQINASYQFELYDATAVLLRRVIETLVIESYEALGRSGEIKDTNGNYYMLRDLVSRSTGSQGLSLGRNAKHAIEQVKEVGDSAAHNRRFLTKRADLDRLQTGARTLAEELIVISGIKR